MTTRSTTTHGAATGRREAAEAIEAEAVTLSTICPLTLCVNRGVPDHDLHII